MLENFGKKVGEVAKITTKKSGDMLEKTKLNFNIKKEEDSIKKLYTEIGKEYYRSVISGEAISEKVGQLCDEIKKHKENIDTIKNEINQI